MATAPTATTHHLECPVCHEGFNEPKLLPCTHLVCRKCVLSWLEKGPGDQNSCPLCRAPILPGFSFREQLPEETGGGDLASQVDALPTDLATAALVESKKTLTGQHLCGCCEETQQEASAFCLQCTIKLCSLCVKIHAKIPASRDHVTEKLSDLTAERLALHRRVDCVSHRGRQAELYCSSHRELVCVLCASTTHRQCLELKGIPEVAGVKREELRGLVRRLKDRESVVSEEMNQLHMQILAAKASFKTVRKEVKTAFDDLQASVEAERQKLNADIQTREDIYLAERKSYKLDLENLEAALSAHRNTAERLVASAPDTSLLSMLENLTARLEDVESQALPENPVSASTPGCLSLRGTTLDKVKKALAVVGVLKDSEKDIRCDDECLWCQSSLEGRAFAEVIKVGDRVRRGRDWQHGIQDGTPPSVGTVTHVAADLGTGYVTVQWDCGNWRSGYRMGIHDCYELKLVFEN